MRRDGKREGDNLKDSGERPEAGKVGTFSNPHCHGAWKFILFDFLASQGMNNFEGRKSDIEKPPLKFSFPSPNRRQFRRLS